VGKPLCLIGIFFMKNQKTKQERLEYIAVIAMQSLIAKSKQSSGHSDKHHIGSICFEAIVFAKEMIKQIDNGQI
jgi:hypothetical protein